MADASLLESFPNPHPGRRYLIEHTAHEFTSLCPVTSQPDHAQLVFRIVPGAACVELRSLKRYLHSFRSDGIFYEDVTNRILDDVVKCCQPRWMELVSKWRVRGGIETTVVVTFGDNELAPPGIRAAR